MNASLNLLGIARRAGKLISGSANVTAAVQKRRASLVVLAADLSETTRRKFECLCKTRGTSVVSLSNQSELAKATGCPGRGVFAITERKLAREFSSLCAELTTVLTGEGGTHHTE